MEINRVKSAADFVKVENVLISTADKSGLEYLVPNLVEINPEITLFSTGGTYTAIENILDSRYKGCLRRISDYTGHAEMQGGLVKTLDYKIYLGLLSESGNSDHALDLRNSGAIMLDLVVVNLYPFAKITSQENTDLEQARGYIDIGGPCMLRAAAKNFLRVTAVCRPSSYQGVIEKMRELGGHTTLDDRFQLAQQVFRYTAEYERAIDEFFTTLSASDALDIYGAT